jgi:hypothetical protein
MLGNIVFTAFPSFSFCPNVGLSFPCPLFHIMLSIVGIGFSEIKHGSNRFTCPCLSLTEYMTVD